MKEQLLGTNQNSTGYHNTGDFNAEIFIAKKLPVPNNFFFF